MLYNTVKIIHILTASLFGLGIAYCCYLWKQTRSSSESLKTSEQIQLYTWLVIIPSALFELMSGFTMISLNHYDYSQTWVTGSVIGFIVVIGSWFTFLYFLLMSQQIVSDVHKPQQSELKFKLFRRMQSYMLIFCVIALACMVFFMANKI